MASVPAPPPLPPARPRRRLSPWRLTGFALLCLAALAWAGRAYLYPEWRANRALEAARQAAADPDPERTRQHLAELLRLRPASADGHFLMARACRQCDDLAAAKKHLAEAGRLRWAPADLELEGHLIEAQEVGPRGPNEQVLQALVMNRHPAERVVAEALAKGYRNAHLPEAAIKWLGIWITRYPDDWLPHLWRGEILAAFELTEDARADLLRVVELRPRHPAARRRLGSIELTVKQDPAAAAGHFDVLLEVAPDDPAGLLGLAECRRRQGDGAGARAPLDRLLAADPGNALACLEYGALEQAAGRGDEAREWARRAERGLPDEPEPHYRLGLLFNLLGKPDDATPHLDRFKQLGDCYRKTADWTKELLKVPKSADLRFQIGDEFFRVGRDATAVAWLTSALAEKPDHVPSHRALAAYYRRTGDPGRAALHQRFVPPEK